MHENNMNFLTCLIAAAFISTLAVPAAEIKIPPEKHPDSSEWNELFKEDLSNAEFPKGIWSVKDGVFTATQDRNLWTKQDYDNFILDLEFKTARGTNSGVHVYFSKPDARDWFNYCVEVQITDDFARKWASKPRSCQCGAVFGHKPPTKSAVKKPGEWNRYTITCIDKKIYVLLNGEMVNEFDMSKWTSPDKGPNGENIPGHLRKKAMSELPTKGRIGFQGKHAGAPIYFRNIRIKELEKAESEEEK